MRKNQLNKPKIFTLLFLYFPFQYNLSISITDYNFNSMLQVLYDCFIIADFDPSDIPFYHYDNYVPRPKISFTVPPNSSRKISLLNSVIILHANNDKTFDFFPRVEIVNETKGTKWSLDKHFVGIPETKGTLITWLCSWKFREELDAGDLVNLTMLSDLNNLHLIELKHDYEAVDEDNVVDQFLRDMTKCSSQFVGSVVFHLFKSHRTLYRMNLVKE